MSLEELLREALSSLGVADDEPLGVACSGGADSMALLHLCARTHPADVVALHVDHGLREGSAGEASFVQEAARSLGLRALATRVEVDRSTGSLEGAARRVRYEALERMAREAPLRSVATAHTTDDQAETVLLRVMRGGGLDAIAPRRGIFIRPLLDTRRDELRAWLRDNSLPWLEDPSNAEERFERNWVRSTLIPLMEERRPGVTPALARVAGRERIEREALDALSSDVFSRAAVDDTGVFVDGPDLELLPAAIAVRVIRSAFRTLGADPSEQDVEAIRRLERGRLRVDGIDVWRLMEGWAFVPASAEPPPARRLPDQGVVEAEDWGIKVRVGPPDRAPWRWRTTVPDEATRLVIRSRREGDRVPTPAGTRKVQDVLVDAKVPRVLRGLVPILAADEQPLAVVGHTRLDAPSVRVVDVEPAVRPSWSRERLWTNI